MLKRNLFVLLVCVISCTYGFIDESLCSYSDTCTVSGTEGACVSMSGGCCSSGTITSGLCPGSDDIKCCTNSKCSTPSGNGNCMQTSKCGGTSVAGKTLLFVFCYTVIFAVKYLY